MKNDQIKELVWQSFKADYLDLASQKRLDSLFAGGRTGAVWSMHQWGWAWRDWGKLQRSSKYKFPNEDAVRVLCVHKLLLPALLILSNVHLTEAEAVGSPVDSCRGLQPWKCPKFESCLPVGTLRRTLRTRPKKPECPGTLQLLFWGGAPKGPLLGRDPRPPQTSQEDIRARRCSLQAQGQVGANSPPVMCSLL